jgi:hypothetical protein
MPVDLRRSADFSQLLTTGCAFSVRLLFAGHRIHGCSAVSCWFHEPGFHEPCECCVCATAANALCSGIAVVALSDPEQHIYQGVIMGVVHSALRDVSHTVGRAATATTMAAGAVGGAAVNGVVGAVTGAVAGVQRGIGNGSHSTPAAVLTLGALGAAGLVEWPVVLAIGGGALLLRQLNHPHAGSDSHTGSTAPGKSVPATSTSSTSQRTPPAKKMPARRPRPTQSRTRR